MSTPAGSLLRQKDVLLLLIAPAVALTLLGSGLSCGRPAEGPPPLFKGHQALTGGSGAKRVGEDCTTYGAGDCASGICLHTHASPYDGYFCVTKCDGALTNGGCPQSFACVQVYPTPQGFVCTPPSSWVAQVAVEVQQ